MDHSKAMMKIENRIESYKNYTIEKRREFHKYPEVSGAEKETSLRIASELDAIGIPYTQVGGYGLVGTIQGKQDGKTLALRADIDALAVQEETGLSFASINKGVSHACGHDGHIASLLTAAKVLYETKEEWAGTIKLFFQPAEEKPPSGARAMIAEGVLDGVDAVMGIHLWNDIGVGKISIEAGARMAASTGFKISVTGKGGHGGVPHECIDATVAASAIVMNLQSIVSRESSPLDPTVVSVGLLSAGSTFNVIAQDAYMEGTIRYFNSKQDNKLKESIVRIVETTASAYRCVGKVEFILGPPPVINDVAMSKCGEKAVALMGKTKDMILFDKVFGSEDFALYTEKVPTLYAFVGTRNTDKISYYPHHHSRFEIDEEALETSSKLYVFFALEYLKLDNE